MADPEKEYTSYDDVISSTSPTNISTEKAPNLYLDEHLTFLYILFVIIVLGNSLVIVAISVTKTRKSRMHIFILNLAIADLSQGMINLLADIIWKNTIHFYGGTAGCKIVRYGQGVVTYASTFALVALSLDRVNAIARPLSFHGDRIRIRVLIGLAWGFAFFFSIPLPTLYKRHLRNDIWQCEITLPEAWMWQMYITCIAVVIFFIPAIIIAVCYIIIVVIIWKKTIMSGSSSSEKTTQYVNNGGQLYVAANNSRFRDGAASSRGVIPRAKMKTIKMTLVIVLVFIFCWSPFFVFDLLMVYEYLPMPLTQDLIALSTFIQSLSSLNSAANPIIYAGFNTKMCVDLFRCRFINRNNHNGSPSNTTNYTQYGDRVTRRHLCD